MECKYEAIFCIVNEGFSGAVMDAARSAGATGGTITRSRGTASAEVEKTFGVTVSSQGRREPAPPQDQGFPGNASHPGVSRVLSPRRAARGRRHHGQHSVTAIRSDAVTEQ